jgi:hypothetical protein
MTEKSPFPLFPFLKFHATKIMPEKTCHIRDVFHFIHFILKNKNKPLDIVFPYLASQLNIRCYATKNHENSDLFTLSKGIKINLWTSGI